MNNKNENLKDEEIQKKDLDNYVYKVGFLRPKKVELPDDYKYYNRNPFFLVLQFFIVIFTNFLLIFYKPFIGLKVKGKKNLKGLKGAVIVSNHIYQIDGFITTISLFPKRLYTSMLLSNLGFPFASKYIRLGGAVPIPVSRKQLRLYQEQTVEILKKDKRVLFYAEAGLFPFCNYIRPFKKGGFKCATLANKPILPIVYTYRQPKGIFKNKVKPWLTLNILPPISPQNSGDVREDTLYLTEKTFKIMSDFFEENSYKTPYCIVKS